MILSKASIKVLLTAGRIDVKPDPELKDESIKLHFSENLILTPKTFVLSKTLEKIKLSKGLCGLYDGYAKLAQRGVVTHLGSMFVDSDTNGQLTLEIINFTDKDMIIDKGDRCGQLVLMEVK
jgi:deoxycytidine triphosphate deaminase